MILGLLWNGSLDDESESESGGERCQHRRERGIEIGVSDVDCGER